VGARALANFLACLPLGVTRWVVAYRSARHETVVRRLARELPIAGLIELGVDSPATIRARALSDLQDAACGFLEFDLGVAGPGDGAEAAALMEFARWPPERVRLCFDVDDANFDRLFAEAPAAVLRRGVRLARRLAEEERLIYRGRGSELRITRPLEPWQVHSGLEPRDYVLPSGEIESEVTSVDGTLLVDGWIVGTIPFGMKYGTIEPNRLRLTLRAAEVVRVEGDLGLVADLEMAFAAEPGLRRVAELGFGLSRASRRAAEDIAVGCAWHERSYGLHLGFGAGLREVAGRRKTRHHLDVVTKHGSFATERGVVARW
jgi:hypothetical protein